MAQSNDPPGNILGVYAGVALEAMGREPERVIQLLIVDGIGSGEIHSQGQFGKLARRAF